MDPPCTTSSSDPVPFAVTGHGVVECRVNIFLPQEVRINARRVYQSGRRRLPRARAEFPFPTQFIYSPSLDENAPDVKRTRSTLPLLLHLCNRSSAAEGVPEKSTDFTGGAFKARWSLIATRRAPSSSVWHTRRGSGSPTC
jgi:hypothetical protein